VKRAKAAASKPEGRRRARAPETGVVTSPRASLRSRRHCDAQKGIEAVGVAVGTKATTGDITQSAPAAGSTSRRLSGPNALWDDDLK